MIQLILLECHFTLAGQGDIIKTNSFGKKTISLNIINGSARIRTLNLELMLDASDYVLC